MNLVTDYELKLNQNYFLMCLSFRVYFLFISDFIEFIQIEISPLH